MLADGLTLLGSSRATNFSVETGDDFPTEATSGELFFKTGVGLHAYDGTSWVPVGSSSGITSIFATFGGEVTTQTGVNRYYPSKTIEIKKIAVWVSTPGSGNVTAAVRKNGTVIATITLNAGAPRTSIVVSPTVQVTENDYLTIDITSGTATDLTVRIDY